MSKPIPKGGLHAAPRHKQTTPSPLTRAPRLSLTLTIWRWKTSIDSYIKRSPHRGNLTESVPPIRGSAVCVEHLLCRSKLNGPAFTGIRATRAAYAGSGFLSSPGGELHSAHDDFEPNAVPHSGRATDAGRILPHPADALDTGKSQPYWHAWG